VESEIENMEM